jgi:hypothetical protein
MQKRCVNDENGYEEVKNIHSSSIVPAFMRQGNTIQLVPMKAPLRHESIHVLLEEEFKMLEAFSRHVNKRHSRETLR